MHPLKAGFSSKACRAGRTLAWSILFAAATTSPAIAQEWATKMFDTTRHDFGTVARGSKIDHHFVITNLYEEDVHIAGVRSSCGCTTPEVTVRTLKTFEKSELVATFNTMNHLGDRNATLTVTFDRPFAAEVQLHIHGYVRSDVVLDPPAVELGTVDEGQPVERKVAIRYAGRDDWKILKVESKSPYLEALFNETQRGGGQVGYELTVKLMPGAPQGFLRDVLVLSTNDVRGTQFPLTVEGRVSPEVSVSPTPLVLGILAPGEKVTKKIVVKAKKPFHILNIECNDNGFTFETNDEAKAVHLVPVTFVAGSTPGDITGKILIETDLEVELPALSARGEIRMP